MSNNLKKLAKNISHPEAKKLFNKLPEHDKIKVVKNAEEIKIYTENILYSANTATYNIVVNTFKDSYEYFVQNPN